MAVGSQQILPRSIEAKHAKTGSTLLEASSQVMMGTVQTTGNTDTYIIAPVTGTLSTAYFSGVDNLAANDTNYVTFSMTNLGTNGGSSTAMLDAGETNTTKVTGGSSIQANARRTLGLTSTSANLSVTKGDRIRVRAAATGTLANTITGSHVLAIFTFTA